MFNKLFINYITKIIYSLANGLSLSVRLEVTTTWLSMDLQKTNN